MGCGTIGFGCGATASWSLSRSVNPLVGACRLGEVDMTELEIRAYRESDQDAVVGLWRECGLVVPQNDPKKDICRKLSIQRELFLVGSMRI